MPLAGLRNSQATAIREERRDGCSSCWGMRVIKNEFPSKAILPCLLLAVINAGMRTLAAETNHSPPQEGKVGFACFTDWPTE